MRISEEALDEFIQIYKDEFGEELDRKEASEMASQVLRLYTCLSRKLPTLSSTPLADEDRLIGFRT